MSLVALSSIDLASDEYGRQAAQLLRDLMKGRAAPKAPVIIQPKGVAARRSTDVLAVGEPAVARAMRFMWDHLDLNLSVDDAADAVGMPRRKIERAFRRHLKRGINAEMHRRRLERCCELLRTTKLSITDLAPMIGFRSADYLHSSFRHAFGMTPRQYRLRAVCVWGGGDGVAQVPEREERLRFPASTGQYCTEPYDPRRGWR